MNGGNDGSVDLGTLLALLLAMAALMLAIVALVDQPCCAGSGGSDSGDLDQILEYLGEDGPLQTYTADVNDFLWEARDHFHVVVSGICEDWPTDIDKPDVCGLPEPDITDPPAKGRPPPIGG